MVYLFIFFLRKHKLVQDVVRDGGMRKEKDGERGLITMGLCILYCRVWIYPVGSDMALKGLKLGSDMIRFHFR